MEAIQFQKFPNIDPFTNLKIKIGDVKYQLLVAQFGEPNKIKSPLTQRKIAVNKIEYKRLINKGYTDDQLLYGDINNNITNKTIDNIKNDLDMDELSNDLSKLSMNEDNVFFGHLCTFILKDKLYCFGKQLIAPPVITCCPTMFNLYIYNIDGLFVLHANGIKKLEFNHPIKSMKYSFGYVFIQTTNNDLYLYFDYEQTFINVLIKNVSLIATCNNHALLYIDNRIYILPHHMYTNIILDELESFKFKDATKICASNRGDLILTNKKLYGIKDSEKWRLKLNNHDIIAIDISCNDYVDMILTKDKIYAFGENKHGQLGQGDKKKYETMVTINVPIGTKRVYCGIHNTIIYNGNYYGFGDNTNNCLGLGDLNSTVPQLIKF